MKTQLNLQRAKTSGPKPSRPFNFKFAAGLACVCVGVALLLPAIKGAIGEHHRRPSGQFQAEVRTLIAEVRYLLTPETDHPKFPVRFDDNTVPVAQTTPARTFATLTSLSNQFEILPKAATISHVES